MTPADWDIYRRWRGCFSKRKLKHPGQAQREAFKLKQRAYKCKYCEYYHLTSS